MTEHIKVLRDEQLFIQEGQQIVIASHGMIKADLAGALDIFARLVFPQLISTLPLTLHLPTNSMPSFDTTEL